MYGTVVGVLRGGPSREHDISLLSGHAVVANLPRDIYSIRDIYIDKEGTWHDRGKPATPADILRTIDVAINALHGEYGEDGEVQKTLDLAGIPYTGSDSLSSYMAMHKVMAKERAKGAGITTPKYHYVERGADVEKTTYDIIRGFHQPVVVKPVRWGSSIGISVVGGYAPVYHAIESLLQESDGVLVEEFIRGTLATVGVIDGFRGESLYALPTVESIPSPTEVAFGRGSREVSPGRFSPEVTNELVQHARTMHAALNLRHYSRSDFIVSPRGVYYLETNSLPGLSKEAHFAKSLGAIGIPFPEFLNHIIGLALAG